MAPDYPEAREKMLELALQFAGHEADDVEAQWKSFDDFIAELARGGWARKDLYRLTADIIDNESARLPEESLDRLFDFDASLTGKCHRDCILRLPNEPTDEENFLEYLYGMRWLDTT